MQEQNSRQNLLRTWIKRAFQNTLLWSRIQGPWTLQDVDIAWLDLIEAKYPKLNRVIHAAMSNSDKSYLIYMTMRLLEMHRILKDTGSIYLHCDPTMSHYLKLVMDAIIGRKNFRNEIVWCYRGAGYPKKDFGRRHDIILRYSKGHQYTFNLGQ